MSDQSTKTPPKGDSLKAQEYITKLVDLINQNKITVTHTDLKRFDPSSLQDHFTIDLKDYQIEISHSKQPDSGNDSFVMIFNNLKHLSEGVGEKVILAYIYLNGEQFTKFKVVADHQIEEGRKREEEMKFKEALKPFDELLDQAPTDELITQESPLETLDSIKTESYENKSADSYLETSKLHQI